LTQSGVFGQVNYKFDGESAEYTVADAEQFVPAVFENFVWFTDAELSSQVRSSVPLFTGVIPLTGNQEGDPYVFSAADWTGNQAISAAELMKLIDLKPGIEADSVRLAGDIAAAKDLYGTKGYMNALVKSSATLDGNRHTAVFHLEVHEGSLYHMGKFQTQDLDPQQAELVRRVWELHEGDVYGASYPKAFLKQHPHELQSLNGRGAVYTQTIHDDTLAGDLTLKFQRLDQ